MYLPITYSLLVEKKACKDQLDLFKEHFGEVNAIPLTKEVAARYGSVFDAGWAAHTLLTKEDAEEYQKAIAPAYAEFDKVRETAYAKYDKVNATDANAWAEYHKVKDNVYAEYRQAWTLAFVEIYKKGLI